MKSASKFAVLLTLLTIILLSLPGCGYYAVTKSSRQIDEISNDSKICVVGNYVTGSNILDDSVKEKIEKLIKYWGWKVECSDQSDVYVGYSYSYGQNTGISSSTSQMANRSKYAKLADSVWENKNSSANRITSFNESILQIKAVDAKKYEKTGEIKSLWISEASSPSSESLREVMDCLIYVGMYYFSKTSDYTQKLSTGSCGQLF